MKYVILSLVLMASLSSCRKERTCSCVTNYYVDGVLEETSTMTHSSSGLSSRVWCSAFESTTEVDNTKMETRCDLD